jgi:hypothetical protein
VSGRRFGARALPLLVYGVAAVVFTWPLALHPSALLGAPAGPGDPYLYVWVLGWDFHTWLSRPLDVLTGRVFDANIFHPAAATLTYSDHLLPQSLAVLPIFAFTHDVALCYNLLLLGSLVASAVAMHVFVTRVFSTTTGAYVAGMAWGFGSFHFAQLLHIQLQALYFLPLTFWYLHRLMHAGSDWTHRLRDAAVLGVFVALQALSSVYYAVIGGLALVIGGAVLIAFTTAATWRRTAGGLLVAIATAVVLVLPVGLVYLRAQDAEGFGRNLYEASHGAAFLDSYVQAPEGNVLYGRSGLLRWQTSRHTNDVSHAGVERELFPGLVVTLLALIGAGLGWRTRWRGFVCAMVAVGLLGFVLSLGPEGIRPLYAAFYRDVFGFQAVRAPARFAVLVLFALTTLAAIACRVIEERRGGVARIRSAIAITAVTLECLHLPITLAAAPATHTEVGQWLAHAPGQGAVAVLPVTIDVDATPAMVQSLEYFRPLVNGYSGQRPAFYTKLADTLSTFPSDEALLALHDVGVQYVVSPGPVDRRDAADGWPLVERARFSTATIYELTWSPEADARFSRLTTVVPPPPGPVPFAPGELATYSVTWDGAGVNVPAGVITLGVEPPRYRLVATATTAPWVARFFDARDRFVTTTNAELLPLTHERDQQEGRRRVTRAFVFDAAAHRVRSGRSLDAARAADAILLPLPEQARDALSALFYVRTLPLERGEVVQFPVDEAGRNVVVALTVAGVETIDVNGTPTPAIRLDPQIRQRVERRQPVTGTVWMSTDRRRVPLKVAVEAAFGRVTLQLTGYQAAP